MGFLIYKKTNAGTTDRFERIKPLKLAGTDGLIARHVKAMLPGQTESWQLDVAGLVKLDRVAGEDLVVLFNVAGSGAKSVCFYELTRVHGSCRGTITNLALDFNIVLDREMDESMSDPALAFEAPAAAMPKKLGEMLSLTGGPGGGDWKWGESALQIGATVVQPNRRSPPCPHDACTGKAATG